MDHNTPTYVQDGEIATLGEHLRYDTNRPGLAGGTEVYQRAGNLYFPRDVAPTSLREKGYFIFAYQSPSFETYLYYDGHDGHDFAFDNPGKALAAADGKVVFKGDYGNTLGRVIEIYHPQGYLTRYAHLASYESDIEVGKEVKAGQTIGDIGGSAVIKEKNKDGQLETKLKDGYWGVHLHFSVFRWNQERGAWQITDPFGWDPWAGPDLQSRYQKQLEDPLVACNGEVSYNLWIGEWPQPRETTAAVETFAPTKDRYVGGWLGESSEEVASPTGFDLQLLYSIKDGEQTAFGLANIDGDDRRIIFTGAVSGAPTLVEGRPPYKRLDYVQQQALITQMGQFAFFVPNGRGQMKLLAINSQGNLIELASPISIIEAQGFSYGFSAWYDPRGNRLALAGPGTMPDGTPSFYLYLIRADGSGFRALSGHTSAFFCNDGVRALLGRYTGSIGSTVTLEMYNLEDFSHYEVFTGEMVWFDVSPDCSKLWVAFPENLSTGETTVYLVDQSGIKSSIVEHAHYDSIVMSPDYRHILYTSVPKGNVRTLYVTTSDGRQVTQLSNADYSRTNGFEASFSNDGSRLLFFSYNGQYSRQALIVGDSDGTNTTELLSVDFHYAPIGDALGNELERGLRRPLMSLQGNWIEVWHNLSPQSSTLRLFGLSGQHLELPWSQCEGFFLYYDRNLSNEKHLADCDNEGYYTLDINGGSKQLFRGKTAGEYFDISSVRFSPDGGRFAFDSRKDGKCVGLYVGNSITGQIAKILDDACFEAWMYR